MRSSFFTLIFACILWSAPYDSLCNTILSQRNYAPATVGFVVQKATSDTPLVALNATTPYYSASVQKLITASAAFSTFGVAYTFPTTFSVQSIDATGTVPILYVRGQGEPSLTVERLWLLALHLHQQGVRRVDSLVVDNSFFSMVGTGPGYEEPGSRSYLAPISALTANFNSVAIHVRPTKIGTDAAISLMPQWPDAKIIGSIATVAGKEKSYDIQTTASKNGTTIRLSGSIGVDAPNTYIYRKVWDPTTSFSQALQSAFSSVGITYNGASSTGLVPETAQLLYDFRGEPLPVHIGSMLKYSNNFIAEMILLSMDVRHGGDGSWSHATKGLTTWWKKNIPAVEPPTFVNGSGMGDGNKGTPEAFLHLLRYTENQPWSPEFKAALPLASMDGTIHDRFKKTPLKNNLRGKTGTLNNIGASNLAGSFTVKNETYHYVLFINNTVQTQYTHWMLQEALLSAVYTELAK